MSVKSHILRVSINYAPFNQKEYVVIKRMKGGDIVKNFYNGDRSIHRAKQIGQKLIGNDKSNKCRWQERKDAMNEWKIILKERHREWDETIGEIEDLPFMPQKLDGIQFNGKMYQVRGMFADCDEKIVLIWVVS